MKLNGKLRRHPRALIGACLLIIMMIGLSVWSARLARGRQEPPDAGQAHVVSADFGAGGMAIKVLGSVVLVLGLLYAGVYAMKSLSGRTGRHLKHDAIEVLHKRHLAPKKAIYVVKVGTKAMVLGVTDSQINHLTDLNDQEIDGLRKAAGTTTKDFKRQFLGIALGVKDKG